MVQEIGVIDNEIAGVVKHFGIGVERRKGRGGQNADNLSIVAVRWEDNYVEPGSGNSSTIHTQTMPLGAITTHLDEFGRNPKYKTELTDEEIERAIQEIRSTIQKYSK